MTDEQAIDRLIEAELGRIMSMSDEEVRAEAMEHRDPNPVHCPEGCHASSVVLVALAA
jgi:hypothetical protein